MPTASATPPAIPFAIVGTVAGSVCQPGRRPDGTISPPTTQQVIVQVTASLIPPTSPVQLPAGSLLPITIPFSGLQVPAGVPFAVSAAGLQIGQPGQSVPTIAADASVVWG